MTAPSAEQLARRAYEASHPQGVRWSNEYPRVLKDARIRDAREVMRGVAEWLREWPCESPIVLDGVEAIADALDEATK